MNHIISDVTGLPRSCKSAAERMAAELAREDAFASLTEPCFQQITELEKRIGKETGEKVALVAYRL